MLAFLCLRGFMMISVEIVITSVIPILIACSMAFVPVPIKVPISPVVTILVERTSAALVFFHFMARRET
jgi:hypothetical protein